MLWIAEKQYLDRSRASVTELRAANDELEAANARLRGLLDDNQQLLGRMHRSYLSTITSLARTVEAKDPLHQRPHRARRRHRRRARRRARLRRGAAARRSRSARSSTTSARSAIPDEILLKPGPLDPEEFAEMRRHPEISSYIVAELELPPIVKQMVRSHHERFDGAGYPDGLVGEEIPLAARILSVADALDAMTSDRPVPQGAAARGRAAPRSQDKAGTQFCPRVVAALRPR